MRPGASKHQQERRETNCHNCHRSDHQRQLNTTMNLFNKLDRFLLFCCIWFSFYGPLISKGYHFSATDSEIDHSYGMPKDIVFVFTFYSIDMVTAADFTKR